MLTTELVFSEGTVKTHLVRIIAKLHRVERALRGGSYLVSSSWTDRYGLAPAA